MLQHFLITMFSIVGLFKTVECPETPQCHLPNCIFSHQKVLNGKKREILLSAGDAEIKDEDVTDQDNGPRKKRRKCSPAEYDITVKGEAEANLRYGRLQTPNSKAGVRGPEVEGKQAPKPPLRAISPPPLRSVKERASELAKRKDVKADSARPIPSIVQAPPAKKTIVESLNPRLLPNPPAPHGTRLQLIRMLHDHTKRLNEELKLSKDPSTSSLGMSAQQLVAAVLNEEESVARHKPSIYLTILKLRIVALKKMKLDVWKSERLKQIASEKPSATPSADGAPKIIETGLSTAEEIAFLPRLFAKQESLVKHGYIAVAPSDEEVEQARKGVEAAQGWEQCDRCNTRFQVFPGRRAEDGALTTGGMCLYHPARPRRPTGDNADKSHREMFYACCNETVGTSTGCTSSDSHVFKISEAKRLALVMPFAETPPNPSIDMGTAVCFDCEMGYTTYGMELIRLTATSWPDGHSMLDILVRPLGEILDLNSRFSGVSPKDFASATTYSPPTSNETSPLQIVDSPSAARALLLSHLSPSTPLIGHAIENDLNAARIIHPSIIDTTLLYPHPRGLPMRLGLKALMKRHLDRDIQMGGDRGHDSAEDARAAGELIRLRIADMWKLLKRDAM